MVKSPKFTAALKRSRSVQLPIPAAMSENSKRRFF